MNLLALQRGLWVACIAAEAVLVGALYYSRLLRRYLFFALYLAFDAIGGVLLIQLDYNSPAYAYGFRIYQISLVVLRLGAAAELYERISEHFLRIGRFRFYLAAVLIFVAILISIATFRPDVSAQLGFPQTRIILFQRFETTVLCLVLLLTRFTLFKFLNIPPPSVLMSLRIGRCSHSTSGSVHFPAPRQSSLVVVGRFFPSIWRCLRVILFV